MSYPVSGTNHERRKARLEALLLGHQRLWRPQPFRIETPDWCAEFPDLADELLALDGEAVERLGADNAALIGLIGRHVPELVDLARLIDLPPSPGAASHPPPLTGEGRIHTDIPGRKQAQIEAYAAALGQPRAPLLEWCAGKGHLGRLLARRWHWPVASLEIDATLCGAGEDLARHAGTDCMQHFIRADALAGDSARLIAGRHAIALHACGDLHTRLIAGSAEHGSPAVDVVPCCYYRTANDNYQPFNETPLQLSRDDLRLAVTETVTASAKQRRQSRQALAWKLAWVELRKHLTGDTGYRTFPPVPEAWLRGSFTDFAGNMLARDRARGLGQDYPPSVALRPIPRDARDCNDVASRALRAGPALPRTPPPRPAGSTLGVQAGEGLEERGGELDLATFEALGHARAARMLRLQLVRLAFRRPLEVWLLMDMAVFLKKRGYTVNVGTFCEPTLTPRNLLLSARKM